MLVILWSLWMGIVWADEPDDFSARLDTKTPISNESIDKAVNTVLDLALFEYEGRPHDACDRKLMTKMLDDVLDRNFPTIYKIMYYNIQPAGVKQFKDLPYQKVPPYDLSLYFAQSAKVRAKGEVFNIGLDKIDHFFSHGATYWLVVGHDKNLPREKIETILKLGQEQEQGPWGLNTSGVKSYGDLSANYYGVYFWRDLFDGAPPFFKCEQGKFVRAKDFKAEDYFHPSMDESLNCSSYSSRDLYLNVKRANDKRKISCPADPKFCDEMKADLGDKAKLLLHPVCFDPQAPFVETPSDMNVKQVLDKVQAVAGGGPNFLLFKLFGQKKLNTNQSAEVAPKTKTVSPSRGINSVVELVEFKEAKSTWRRYLGCKKQSSGKSGGRDAFETCLVAEMAPELVPPLKQKLAKFRDQGMPFSELRECLDEDLVRSNSLNKDESEFCFSLQGLKEGGQGYVLFKKADRQAKILAVKFKP